MNRPASQRVGRAIAEFARSVGARERAGPHSCQALVHFALRVVVSRPRGPADHRERWRAGSPRLTSGIASADFRDRLGGLPGTVLCKVSWVTLSVLIGFNLYWFAKALLSHLHNKRFGESAFSLNFGSPAGNAPCGAAHLVPLPWGETADSQRARWFLGTRRRAQVQSAGPGLGGTCGKGLGKQPGVQGSQPRGQQGDIGHVVEGGHGAATISREGVWESGAAADATAQTASL